MSAHSSQHRVAHAHPVATGAAHVRQHRPAGVARRAARSASSATASIRTYCHDSSSTGTALGAAAGSAPRSARCSCSALQRPARIAPYAQNRMDQQLHRLPPVCGQRKLHGIDQERHVLGDQLDHRVRCRRCPECHRRRCLSSAARAAASDRRRRMRPNSSCAAQLRAQRRGCRAAPLLRGHGLAPGVTAAPLQRRPSGTGSPAARAHSGELQIADQRPKKSHRLAAGDHAMIERQRQRHAVVNLDTAHPPRSRRAVRGRCREWPPPAARRPASHSDRPACRSWTA